MTGAELLKKVEDLIDAEAGVLRSLEPMTFPPPYAAQMYAFSATVGRVSELHPRPVVLGHELGEIAGYGTGLDETLAQVRAVYEGLERYCSVMYPTEGVIVATTAELGDDVLDPRRLPQCSDAERARALPSLRLRVPDAAREERWVRGYSLTRRRPVWVPLTAAYMGLPDPVPELLSFPISTGFAAGISFEQAALSGLCEVIERDSLALWWLHQLPLPRIDVRREFHPDLSELLTRAERAGIRTELYDLTTDVGVPVIGLIQTTERGWPHAVTMAACRPDAAAAAVRVVEEAGSLRLALGWSGRQASREAILSGLPQPPEAFGLLYAGEDGPARFAFANRNPEVKSELPPGVGDDSPLERIVEQLAGLEMEVFVVDVTSPEIREFGVVVVRVIVPELMPITFSHSIRYLGHPRLYTAPAKLGYGTRTEDSVTNDPIPYA